MKRSLPISLLGGNMPNISVVSFYKSMFQYQKKYPLLLSILLLSVLFIIDYEITVPLVFKWMFDRIFHTHDIVLLFEAITILAISLFLLIASSIMLSYAASLMSAKLISLLRFKIFNKMLKTNPHAESRHLDSDIIFIFTNDLTLVESISVYIMWSALSAICMAIIGVFMLIYFDWVLTLFVGIILPFVLVLPKILSSRSHDYLLSKKDIEKKLLHDFQETLTLQEIIKLFALRRYKLNQFRLKLRHLIKASYSYNWHSVLSGRISYFGLSLIRIMVLCVGGYLVVQNQLSVGRLIGFIVLLGTITAAINTLMSLHPLLTRCAESMSKIQAFIGEVEPSSIQLREKIAKFSHAIRFENVTMDYASKLALKNISIDIEKGKYVALVGQNGSGKTTFLKLLLKQLTPTYGSIFFDKVNYQDIASDSILQQIGVVTQEPRLFETSIYENIRMGKLNATQAEIYAAAEAAGIHEDIQGLEKAYETHLGKNSAGLSVGQAQRIAIARALVKKPAILCLDEATTALDPFNSALIDELLQSLAGTHTIIAISHRLSSVVNADIIFVLDKGEIVEKGTHASLVNQNGIYQRLWEKQNNFILNEHTHEINLIPRWLSKIHLFEDLDNPTLEQLSQGFVIESCQAKSIVFKQNDPPEKFYVLITGTVNVIQVENDKEEIITTLSDGDYFGEVGLLYGTPRIATIMTKTFCIFLTLHYQIFNRILLILPPKVRAHLIEKASERLSSSQKEGTLKQNDKKDI